MRTRANRLEALRRIISTQQLNNQEELMGALQAEGFQVTQGTLSRDLKQLKVTKTSAHNSKKNSYTLPNETTYKRVSSASNMREMMQALSVVSLNFSGNLGIIKTRPGHASAIAWRIDRTDIPQILGTIAGDDTIFMVIKEGVTHQEVTDALAEMLDVRTDE